MTWSPSHTQRLADFSKFAAMQAAKCGLSPLLRQGFSG